MKERPMLFNSEMVKAVLDGRKIQTRRLIKPQLRELPNGFVTPLPYHVPRSKKEHTEYCPLGQVGDRLYIRETCCIAPKNFATPDDSCIPDKDGDLRIVSYKADGHSEEAMRDYNLKWTPSIHMPKWASRITLEITNIRVERIQDINEADAEGEGIQFLRDIPDADETLTARELFWCLWDSIYKNWDNNPWVWVVEFKVI